MNGKELIQKYFLINPDSAFDSEFIHYGGFFCDSRNSIFHYERLSDRSILIKYEQAHEIKTVPWTDGKGRMGDCKLMQPYQTSYKSGSFICVSVNKIVEIEPIKGWRWKDVRIKKRFWSKSLFIQIDNENLNLKFECLSILPYSLSNERTNFK